MSNKNNNQKELYKLESEQGFIEKWWEKFLWSTRYVVVLAVLFSTLGSITLFIVGSYGSFILL